MEFAMVPDPLVTGELKKRVCQARMEGSLSHSVPHWNLKCQSVAVTGSYSLIFYNSSRSKIPQGLFPLFLHLSVVGGGNFLAPPPPPLPPSPPLPPPPPLQSPEWWLGGKCFLKNNLSMAELHEWFPREDLISVFLPSWSQNNPETLGFSLKHSFSWYLYWYGGRSVSILI